MGVRWEKALFVAFAEWSKYFHHGRFQALCDIAELGRDVHTWLSSAGNSELQHTTGKRSLDGRVPVRVE